MKNGKLQTLEQLEKELRKDLYLGRYGWKLLNQPKPREEIKANLRRVGYYVGVEVDMWLDKKDRK